MFQLRDNANDFQECASGPDVSREGPFDIHRVMHQPDTPLRSRQDGQGFPFRFTSYKDWMKCLDCFLLCF